MLLKQRYHPWGWRIQAYFGAISRRGNPAGRDLGTSQPDAPSMPVPRLERHPEVRLCDVNGHGSLGRPIRRYIVGNVDVGEERLLQYQ